MSTPGPRRYYALASCRPGERRTIQVQLTAEAAAGHLGAIVRGPVSFEMQAVPVVTSKCEIDEF
jgi:hypothetical protein